MGGITRFKDCINKPFIEEFIITIMGPIFQIIISFLLNCYYDKSMHISNILLIFNLLPILPLDGGRLLCLILSLFKSFKRSMIITIKISYIIYLLLLAYILKVFSLFFIFIIISLLFKIIEENKKMKYYYYSFIMERYLFKKRYKTTTIINKLDDMYKYRNNMIKDKNCLFDEKEYIEIKLTKKEL